MSRVRPPSPAPNFHGGAPQPRGFFHAAIRRGTQVVRERSAKPLYVGSIPTRASKFFLYLGEFAGFSAISSFALRCARLSKITLNCVPSWPDFGPLNSPFRWSAVLCSPPLSLSRHTSPSPHACAEPSGGRSAARFESSCARGWPPKLQGLLPLQPCA